MIAEGKVTKMANEREKTANEYENQNSKTDQHESKMAEIRKLQELDAQMERIKQQKKQLEKKMREKQKKVLDAEYKKAGKILYDRFGIESFAEFMLMVESNADKYKSIKAKMTQAKQIVKVDDAKEV
jgi:hypothetical protein